jgi:adhesin transport system outer membrane protein
MMKKIRMFQLTTAVAGMLFWGGISQGETLEDAVRYMIETHPEVRTVVYNRLARDQQVKQARGGYFPELGINAWAGIREYDEPTDDNLDPWQFTLSLRQNLFRGFQDVKEVDRHKYRVRSQAYVIQSVAENTALDAARAYLEVLRKQEFVELARENLKLHQRIADQIKLRSESGVDRKADMTQVESRLALAQSNLVVTETNLDDAKTNYLAIVGRMPEDLVKPELPPETLPVSLEEAQQKALKGHPTLKQAREDLDARRAQDEVAKAPFWPIVDVEVDKSWHDELERGLNTDTEELTALVRVRYNFFRGWRDRARKVETTYQISEAREVRNNSHRQLIELVRLSWMAYKAAGDRREYLEQRVESSSKTAESYSRQWDIGKRTLLDVLDAEAERIESRKELIDSNYAGLFAQYRILNAMGELVHTLGLKWPEEAYVEEGESFEDEEKGKV